MAWILKLYDRLVLAAASSIASHLVLFFTRFVLAGVFWRSGRSKVEDGSLLQISEATHYLFENDYAAVPLPAALAAPLATYAEHLFPVLLVLGLFTRLSACALLLMTFVIQVFVYPQAWWTAHALWVALALIIIHRGAGALSLDHLLLRFRSAQLA